MLSRFKPSLEKQLHVVRMTFHVFSIRIVNYLREFNLCRCIVLSLTMVLRFSSEHGGRSVTGKVRGPSL